MFLPYAWTTLKKTNLNIPSKTKSFQRLQIEEVTELKIKGEQRTYNQGQRVQ